MVEVQSAMRYHVILTYFDYDDFKMHDLEIFDMIKDDMVLVKPTIEKEANTPSKFSFGVYPNNIGYKYMNDFLSYIRVYDGDIKDDNCIFYGKRQSFTKDYDQFMKITFAGALEFLKGYKTKLNQNYFSNDYLANSRKILQAAFNTDLPQHFHFTNTDGSTITDEETLRSLNIERFYTYDDNPHGAFGFLLNDGVSYQDINYVDWREFSSNYDEETGKYSFEYVSCYDLLQKFLEMSELNIKLVYTSDPKYAPYNVIPIFYNDDYLNTRDAVQKIESKNNLLDLVTDVNLGELHSAITFVDPETDEPIDDPNHANQKYYYIYDELFFKIGFSLLKAKYTDQFPHPGMLDFYSRRILFKQFNDISYDIKAIDKSFMSKNENKIDIYDSVDIYTFDTNNNPLVFLARLPVNKMTMDLVSPEESQIIVGSNYFRKDISKIVD